MATDWSAAFKPLIKKYKTTPHPLEYKNMYQLLVMVVLAARNSDKQVNLLAPALFKAYPNMKKLSNAKEAELFKLISSLRGFADKGRWLIELAGIVKNDNDIPLTM